MNAAPLSAMAIASFSVGSVVACAPATNRQSKLAVIKRFIVFLRYVGESRNAAFAGKG
jgi:hypothetical protein